LLKPELHRRQKANLKPAAFGNAAQAGGNLDGSFLPVPLEAKRSIVIAAEELGHGGALPLHLVNNGSFLPLVAAEDFRGTIGEAQAAAEAPVPVQADPVLFHLEGVPGAVGNTVVASHLVMQVI